MLKKLGMSKTQRVMLWLNILSYACIIYILRSAVKSTTFILLFVASFILIVSIVSSITLCASLVEKVAVLEQEIKEIKNEKAEKNGTQEET
ncbi:MAG: hypothetical protein GX802_00860 [Clostridiales bacterium]|jgi:predicted membrane channel-forming protein YqfA (hemolysin III family)|nr:hypothetical protein [Clostridiales bacterium]